ncbi:hypothetical protein [Hyphococcus sp.]|jgi:hypothetical protein|uniref:hypothetical protein n=1 Tax=Hyphococcus sp. TaxID=2038636 RepID=UPI003D0A19E2
MQSPFRRFFHAVSSIADSLRLILLLVCAAAIYFSVRHEPVVAFAGVTAVITLFASTPHQWRMLLFERPFFFRRQFSGVTFAFIVSFLLFNIVFRAVATGFAALFTFPDADSVKKISVTLGDAMAADLQWTIALFGGAVLFCTVLLFLADRFGQVKAARWAFFRLPILFGLVYSALVVTITDYSVKNAGVDNRVSPEMNFAAGPVFPTPSTKQAGDAVRAVFGRYVFSQDFIDEVETLQSNYETLFAQNKNLTSALSQVETFSSDIAGDFLSLVEQAESGDLCEKVGDRYMRVVGKTGPFNVFDKTEQAGYKPRVNEIILFQPVRDAENIIWRTAHCGYFRGEAWCADQTASYGDDAASADAFRKEWGCDFPGAKIAMATDALNAGPAEPPADIDMPKTGDEERAAPTNLTDGVAVLSILDAFIQDRLTEAADRAVIAGSVAVGNFLNGTNYTSGLAELEWTVSVCESGQATPWCGFWLRKVSRIVISPYVLQGLVISIYATVILMVFRRRDDRGRKPLDWSAFGREVWDFKSKRRKGEDDSSGASLT